MKVERASEEKKSQMMEEGENDDRNVLYLANVYRPQTICFRIT